MTPLTLAALESLVAAGAMAALWAWWQFPALTQLLLTNAHNRDLAGHGPYPRRVLGDAGWTTLIAAFAILDGNLGGGAWGRRTAMAWMMGSWGARLVVHLLYAPPPPRGVERRTGAASSFWFFQGKGASALFFSLPALVASVNRDPNLSTIELAACGLWIIGFAGETTADRQLLRFTSNPANVGLACRFGLWRYSRHWTAIFEGTIWIAYALFAFASPWPFA
jgi:steroid 5-alpha reductase family enzyme